MKCAFVLLMFLPIAAAAQDAPLPLAHASGTATNPGPSTAVVSRSDAWSTSVDGAAFVTHANTTGPKPAATETFSTNWLSLGAQRTLGTRGVIALRLRGSLEPWTIRDDGYPQLLQIVSPEHGGPMLDRMRAHRALDEASLDAGVRLGGTALLHVYAAPVGDPALGAVPFAQRASALDFAEAPFAYDIQETLHEATRVITGGLETQFVTLEASVFHQVRPESPFTSTGDGAIDSSSARLTVRPTSGTSLQFSTGKLGDADLKVSTASASVGTGAVSASAIWTRRDLDATTSATALGGELQLRSDRSTAMLRAEVVDTPRNRAIAPTLDRLTHLTAGYIFEGIRTAGWRAGLGANLDYTTKFREFDPRYGHKPQTVFLFLRVRTDGR